MENAEIDEIPAVKNEPAEVNDQIFDQEVKGTRVLEQPEMDQSEPKQPQHDRPAFDIANLSFELQQGYRIYSELLSDSIRNITWPFLDPVDADSLGLWDYYDRIKQPMCFSTIGSKFVGSKYTGITEVIADIRLILENCYRYNGPNHWVSKLGQKLEKILEQKLALLNRSLRDKVTLAATMTVNKGLPLNDFEVSGRRRSIRQNYLSMVNGENSSSLVNHLKILEESEEKERRRQREKEKKEANQALLQDLVEWEEKELKVETIDQLHSMWEIPSIGSLLYMVKDILGIDDINLTEFELSFVYPNKSSLLARIFTALLITPHQRKSIYKRSPMKFKMWESKLKEKLDIWYKMLEKDGLYMVSLHLGIDLKFFDILGSVKNPLEEKSYLDLSLHQRVWVLKALSDFCFHKDYDIREKVNTCDFMEQRELFLGFDDEDHSYIYFPIFQTTDLRVYRHDALEVPSIKPKKEPSPPPPPPPTPPPPSTPEQRKSRRTPSKSNTPARPTRLRQLRSYTKQILEDELQEEEKDQDHEPNKCIQKQNEKTLQAKEDISETATEDETEKDTENSKEKTEKESANKGEQNEKDCEKLSNCGEASNSLDQTSTEENSQPMEESKDQEKSPIPPPPPYESEDGFHMACHDIDTLKILVEKFAEPPTAPPPKKRHRKSRPPTPRKRCLVDLHETLLALLQELEKYEVAFSKNYTKARIKIMKESLEPEPIDEPEPEPEQESAVDDWGSDISDDDAGAKIDSKDEDFRIEDEYNSPVNNIKREELNENVSDNDESLGNTAILSTRKRKHPKDEDSGSTSISMQTSTLKIKRKPKKWSPTKEKYFPLATTSTAASLPSPTVIISPVSAKESLKATGSIPKPDLAKCSPDKILLNALEHALKKAKENAVKEKEVSEKPSSTLSPKTTLGSSRKRVLVSPEGKTHEIKPSFHVVSTEALLPNAASANLPSRPPVQRRSDLLAIVSSSSKTTATLGSQGINTRPNPQSIQTTVRSSSFQTMAHSRPNILSRAKKPTTAKTGVPTHKNTVQGTLTPNSQASQVGISSNVKIVQLQPANASNIAKGNTSTAVSQPSQRRVIMTKDGVTKVFSKPLNPNKDTASNKITTANTGTTENSTKTKGPQPTTTQKILFIPASSVDTRSPLASFKPQTITTSSGQSIYGYAVVVPPGSNQDFSAMISSSIKKPVQTSGKQGINLLQGKTTSLTPTSQGKPLTVVSQGKSTPVTSQRSPMTVTSPSKSTTLISQGQQSASVLQGKQPTLISQGKSISITSKQKSIGAPQTQSAQVQGQTVFPGQPTVQLAATALSGKNVIQNVQNQVLQTSPGQGKPPVNILQGNLQGMSTVNLIQGNVQGKPTTHILQGKIPTTLSLGKTSTTVVQEQPAVSLVLHNQTAGSLQGKTLNIGQTNTQGKAIVVQGLTTGSGQGKPIFAVLQGKTPDGKQTVLSGSNVAALLSSLGHLQSGVQTLIQPSTTSKNVVIAPISSKSQSVLCTSTTGSHSPQQSNNGTKGAAPAVTLATTTNLSTSQSQLFITGKSTVQTAQAAPLTLQSTSASPTVTSTPGTVTTSLSTVSKVLGSLLAQQQLASLASAKNDSSVLHTANPSSTTGQIADTSYSNTKIPSQAVKLTLLQQARQILASGESTTQTPVSSSTLHCSPSITTDTDQHINTSAIDISQSALSQPAVTLSTSLNSPLAQVSSVQTVVSTTSSPIVSVPTTINANASTNCNGVTEHILSSVDIKDSNSNLNKVTSVSSNVVETTSTLTTTNLDFKNTLPVEDLNDSPGLSPMNSSFKNSDVDTSNLNCKSKVADTLNDLPSGDTKDSTNVAIANDGNVLQTNAISRDRSDSDSNTVSHAKSMLNVVPKDSSYTTTNIAASTTLPTIGLHCSKDSEEKSQLGNSTPSSTVTSA